MGNIQGVDTDAKSEHGQDQGEIGLNEGGI